MNFVINFLEKYAMPIAAKIASLRYIRALRDGLAVTMPLIIVGSVFMILGNIPIPGYAEWMAATFGPDILTKILYPVRVTFDIVAVIAVMSISYQIAKEKDMDAFSAAAISLAAYLLLIPVNTVNNVILESGEKLSLGRVWPTGNFSAGGLMVAIITAFIATEIFMFIVKKNFVIKMPDSVPPAVSKSFTAIVPCLVILLLFWCIRLFFESTEYETIFVFITKFVATPLSKVGLSFGGALGTIFLYHLFWTMGIHGTRVVFGVMDSILLPAMDQNRQALEAGLPLPNIVTKQFHDNFVNGLGGCGATIGLIICIFIIARSKQIKSIGKLAIGPAIFNISEPIIFGIPVVMNPIMMIPFTLAPMAVGAITYVSMALGLVNYPAGIAVPWTVPSFFSGFLATNGDWRAIILQAVNIAVSALIYWPFLKAWDLYLQKQEAEEEASHLSEHKN